MDIVSCAHKYPFAVRNHEVKIFRYQVNYLEMTPVGRRGRELAFENVPRVTCCNTEEEARNFKILQGGEIHTLDCSSYEWMDGIQVENFFEAIGIYLKGPKDFKLWDAFRKSKSPDKLRLDLDYIMFTQKGDGASMRQDELDRVKYYYTHTDENGNRLWSADRIETIFHAGRMTKEQFDEVMAMEICIEPFVPSEDDVLEL